MREEGGGAGRRVFRRDVRVVEVEDIEGGGGEERRRATETETERE